MLLAGYDVDDINSKMDNLIDLVSLSINKAIHSVIVKIGSGTPYVGKMSKGGSFTPAYNNLVQVPDDLLSDLQSIYTKYTRQYPARRTLFFRYNNSKNVLECFSASSMVSTSKIN